MASANVVHGFDRAGGQGAVTDDELRVLAAVAALTARYGDRARVRIALAGPGGTPPLTAEIGVDPGAGFATLLREAAAALKDADTASATRIGGAADIDDRSEAPDALVVWDQEAPVRNGVPTLIAHRGRGGYAFEFRGTGAAAWESRFVSHLEVLLGAAAAASERPLAELPVLGDAERRRILSEFNSTASGYPHACMHELFEARAAAAGDATAVCCGDAKLTYRELDQRANQLAHHLAGLGVKADVLVGICVERSVEMLVGLLGILKAGGAYVPIDPTYPAERQEYMISQSQAPVIVTQERLEPQLPRSSARVVCLDRDWPAIGALPTEPPGCERDAEQLAYVIYTSGSTGRPKGVQIPHRALVNFLCTMAERPGLSADDVLVAVTTLSFDIAGLELFLPLISGARVVVAPTRTAGDGRALASLLADSGATVMQATPTTWRMLLDSGWEGRPPIRALCGGEALPTSLAEQLVGLGLELWNMYGPTETTIWSTCKLVGPPGHDLTIGHPIANTKLYVLDGAMAPQPIGVAGELWIGGDGLARGYRGRDDLTAERFVPDPFDRAGAARIYRTGDLARYREDGEVEFLGRIDHQVKVRGFRIELGEVETSLARHPGISEAVVVARGTGADAELAAYVIPAGQPVGAGELRAHLALSLPPYMIPSTVTSLQAFPQTPNGKVDRKALPEPTRERSGDRALVAPRTELERRLAAVWERELQIQPIGVDDNFFDLGVTSIVAANLFAAIERDLGDGLPLGAIFRAPTIGTLAELIEHGEGETRWTSLVPIQPLGDLPPIFCVHGGAGTILHLEPLARRLGTEQPFYGLQSSGLYGGSAPIRTVESMAEHYLAEMRQIERRGPWLIAGYCFGSIVAFEIAQRLVAAGEPVGMLAVFNGPSPSWIKQWGWFGNQPSIRATRPRPVRLTRKQKLRRALREPRRFVTAAGWHAQREYDRRYAKYALAHGRPLPERLREQFFFGLHATAERAYEPSVYPGDMLVFYGQGLYEDPTLGWDGLAAGGVATYAVPGEHTGNRDAMREPNVEFVAERIAERLARPQDHAAQASAP